MKVLPIITTGGCTFERNGRTSKIDVAYTDKKTYENLYESVVLKTETASDHKYLKHVIKTVKQTNMQDKKFKIWNYNTLNEEKFKETIDIYVANNENEEEIMSYGEVREYLRAVTLACGASMKSKQNTNGKKKANTWWNNEIKELRKEMNRKRRKYQKARKKNESNYEELNEEYKQTRKKLKYKICDSKKEEWRKLCEELDKDIWGRPYKNIMNQIKKKMSPPMIGKEKATQILETLFPGEETEELKDYETRIEIEMREEGNKIYLKTS